MVLKGANSLFGSIAAMVVGRDKLIGDIAVAHKLFEAARWLVVQALEHWFEASGGK
jgi:hypothetical protein